MKDDKTKGSKGGAMSMPNQSSRMAVQDDIQKDHFPGGIITTPKQKNETGGRLPTDMHKREDFPHKPQNRDPVNKDLRTK